MPTTDRPATPEMKLFVRQRLAEGNGKEFNEVLEREVLGLPPAKNPVFIPENPSRARDTRREDMAGKRELEEMAKAAERTDLAMQLRERDDRIAEMERQLRELTGGNGPAPRMTMKPPVTAEGDPDETWTMKQIVQWGSEHGVLVPSAGKSMSKREALNHIKEQLAHSEAPAEYEELDDAEPEEDEAPE